jgi:hypothetical protein
MRNLIEGLSFLSQMVRVPMDCPFKSAAEAEGCGRGGRDSDWSIHRVAIDAGESTLAIG